MLFQQVNLNVYLILDIIAIYLATAMLWWNCQVCSVKQSEKSIQRSSDHKFVFMTGQVDTTHGSLQFRCSQMTNIFNELMDNLKGCKGKVEQACTHTHTRTHPYDWYMSGRKRRWWRHALPYSALWDCKRYRNSSCSFHAFHPCLFSSQRCVPWRPLFRRFVLEPTALTRSSLGDRP